MIYEQSVIYEQCANELRARLALTDAERKATARIRRLLEEMAERGGWEDSEGRPGLSVAASVFLRVVDRVVPAP